MESLYAIDPRIVDSSYQSKFKPYNMSFSEQRNESFANINIFLSDAGVINQPTNTKNTVPDQIKH